MYSVALPEINLSKLSTPCSAFLSVCVSIVPSYPMQVDDISFYQILSLRKQSCLLSISPACHIQRNHAIAYLRRH